MIGITEKIRIDLENSPEDAFAMKEIKEAILPCSTDISLEDRARLIMAESEAEIAKLTFLTVAEKLTLQGAVDKYGNNLTKEELIKLIGIVEKPKDGIYGAKITVK